MYEGGYPDATGFYQYDTLLTTVKHDFTTDDFEPVGNSDYSGVGVKFMLPGREIFSGNFLVGLSIRIRIRNPQWITNFNIMASYVHSYIQLLFEPSIEMSESVAGAIGLSFTQGSNLTYIGMDYCYTPE